MRWRLQDDVRTFADEVARGGGHLVCYLYSQIPNKTKKISKSKSCYLQIFYYVSSVLFILVTG
jgi:hypothetical protein